MNDGTATATRTMTAWRQLRYGGPEAVRAETIPVPVPRRGEVLVRLDASSINSGDIHLMRGEPRMVRLFFGLRRPRVAGRGMDLAGTIVASRRGCRRPRDRRPGRRRAQRRARGVHRGAGEAAVAHPRRSVIDGCRHLADRGEHRDHDPRPLPCGRGVARARDRCGGRCRHPHRAAGGRARRRGLGDVRSARRTDPAAARRHAHVRLPHDRSGCTARGHVRCRRRYRGRAASDSPARPAAKRRLRRARRWRGGSRARADPSHGARDARHAPRPHLPVDRGGHADRRHRAAARAHGLGSAHARHRAHLHARRCAGRARARRRRSHTREGRRRSQAPRALRAEPELPRCRRPWSRG